MATPTQLRGGGASSGSAASRKASTTPGAAASHQHFHADPAGAGGGGEDELRRELEYTRDVLRRYREYVQVNYDRKLQETAEETELLRQELQEYEVENRDLKQQVNEARESVHRASMSQDQAYKEVRSELGRVLDQHEEHVTALNAAHKQERDTAAARIAELEADVARLRTLSDPDALRREADAEAKRKIAHLERQLEAERVQANLSTQKLQQAEQARASMQAVEKQLRSIMSNVHDLARDSHETSGQLGVAMTHSGVDAVNTDDLSAGWHNVLQLIAVSQQQQQQQPGVESLAALNQSLLASLLEVRRAVASERSCISRCVRQLLGDKEAAEVELQRKEAVFQNELQLFQRRMTELEEDRYAEHYAANTAADRQRHMELLKDPRSAVDIEGNANNTSSAGGAPSRSQLMAAASGDGIFGQRGGLNTSGHFNNHSAAAAHNLPDSFSNPASLAPYYGQRQGPASSSAAGHRRTIAVQTGVELMALADASSAAKQGGKVDNSAADGGGASRPSRLVSELEETQEQLTRAREVVRLLDMQRQQFMYFVDDPRLEEDIARALGAGSVTTSDFVALSGRRFVHHTQ